MLMKFKYEKEFREAHPETTGEKDSAFDLCNYTEWLETIVSRVELPVKPANGDIAIDILDEKEKYYTKLLKEDVKNQDHIACIVCESKLDFINEMQKELVSRLSV